MYAKMNQCKVSISDKIKEYRKKNYLSQESFGKKIGVSAQAVSKWEKEICYPDLTLLPQLAEIIGCQINDFFVQR